MPLMHRMMSVDPSEVPGGRNARLDSISAPRHKGELTFLQPRDFQARAYSKKSDSSGLVDDARSFSITFYLDGRKARPPPGASLL